MPARTSENRLIAIQTALEGDVVLLKGFQMTDELGRLFSCELDLRSEESEITFEELIGTNATIRVSLKDGGTRYINGIISRMVQEGTPSQGRANRYRATMVPWLWLLTRTSDCRIFQDKTIPEIVQEVFKDFGFSGEAFVRVALTGTYAKREYVVQYRETAFAFVSRLMEEEGIYYFFEHSNGQHVLVLTDAPSTHEPVAGYETVDFAQQERDPTGRETVWEWVVEKQLQPNAIVQNDFDFKVPKKNLLADAEHAWTGDKPAVVGEAPATFELFEYPGGYTEMADGTRLSKARVEEQHAQYEVARARGDVRALVVGARFELAGHPRADQDREYVVTSGYYHAETDDYGAGGGGGGGTLYQCGFTAIPSAVPFRTQRTTAKPVIPGPQTAIVVGPSGQEVEVDEYGRVRVHFHWNRWSTPSEHEKCSCWIRVAQLWAGKKWGAMFIPRVGQEVVVEFLDGDPDRPIVTGRVYNNDCQVPYALPDHKTRSTIKTNSTTGGEGYNELRFEDKKGEEMIFIHAEKDMDVRVKNDSKRFIGHDDHLIVANDRFEHVKHDRHLIVDQDSKSFVKRDLHLKVDGKHAQQVTKSYSLTVDDDVIQVFKKNASTAVTNDLYLKADNIVIEAATNITLKVGGSWIAIEASSITAKSTDIEFKADGGFKAKGGGTLDLEAGGAGTLKASAALTVKGATTAIG
jgi:type VI secretion system secreted protein VgrG